MTAARTAAEWLGIPYRASTCCTNNVVVRIGDVVLKVGGNGDRLRREVALAAHAARNRGPVIPPLGRGGAPLSSSAVAAVTLSLRGVPVGDAVRGGAGFRG